MLNPAQPFVKLSTQNMQIIFQYLISITTIFKFLLQEKSEAAEIEYEKKLNVFSQILTISTEHYACEMLNVISSLFICLVFTQLVILYRY